MRRRQKSKETTMADPSVDRKGHTPPASDLYQIDHFLSEKEQQVRDRVRTFVQQRVLPIAGKHFAAQTLPQALVPELADLRVLGMQIKGYGCAGRGAV
jgi:glutaryl-CoA dehydrogenase